VTVADSVDYRRFESCQADSACGKCGAARLVTLSDGRWALWVVLKACDGQIVPEPPEDATGVVVCALCGEFTAWVA
jgi:hypothetical protein